MRREKVSGFTLLEMSIVMVVIGLIIGGVVVGQDMVRSANINNIVAEKAMIDTAIDTFRSKYDDLPGDMSDATDYWTAQHATAATCKTTASTGAPTCNGDGDGRIDSSTGSVEYFRFWQHLKNADLIQGSFDGIRAGITDFGSDSSNSLESKAGDLTIWGVYDLGTQSGDGIYFDNEYSNSFVFGKPVTNTEPTGAYFTPGELLNLDEKLDDGMPGTGKLIAANYDECTDAADETETDADYLLSEEGEACAAVFRQEL